MPFKYLNAAYYYILLIFYSIDCLSLETKKNNDFNIKFDFLVKNQTNHTIFHDNNNDYDDSIVCKTDANCFDSNSICLNGTCSKLCNNNNNNNNYNKNCIYFHCDGKLSSLIESKHSNSTKNFIIETNNYPLLERYLSNKKCSWILKNLNYNNNSEEDESLPFIQLNIERFSTELSNDYLYIFAGDSIFSPLIAALSGTELASNEPSIEADYDFDSDHNENTFNITFTNITSIYLLFKSDVTSQFQSNKNNNNFKPNGISIKYKFSSPCKNENDNDRIECVSKLKNFNNSKLNIRDTRIKSNKKRQIETVNYMNTETNNSNLRRAFHCSFLYQNYYYIIGGYSFVSKDSFSFISRLNLIDLNWQHDIDKPHSNKATSSTSNRSNRRHYSDFNFKPDNKLDQLEFPSHRYAHSCVLDEKNNQFFMYGGIKYENNSNKQVTNELWKFNLITQKWFQLLESTTEQLNNKTTTTTKQYVLPVSVAGHSMHLNNNSILIFFGFSEYYGSTLNLIQEYNLTKKTWRIYQSVAFNINIGFAHSLTIADNSSIFYMFGGLNINSPISNNSSFLFDSIRQQHQQQSSHISANMYSFNVKSNEWKQLASSNLASYLHTSNLYKNSYILTYGGIVVANKHKNNSNLLISNQLRLFNLKNNKWFEHPVLYKDENIHLKFKHRQRYSHTSFVYNQSLFIFAGFNGFFLSDLFKFNIEQIVPYCNEFSGDCDWIEPFEANSKRRRRRRQNENSILLFQDTKKPNKEEIISSPIEICNTHITCVTCQSDINCIWNLKKCEYFSFSSLLSLSNETQQQVVYKKPTCANICSEFKNCFNCTSSRNDCVWCATQAKCVLSKAIQVYFPFGECFNYMYDKNQCELIKTPTNNQPQLYPYANLNSNIMLSVTNCVNQYSNCSACIRDEKCGWCSKDTLENNDNSMLAFNTGTGICIEGGETNSYGNRCKFNWFFSQCPNCECNGHSVCEYNDYLNQTTTTTTSSSVIKSCSKCLNNTDGENCDQCKSGYFGNPKNNGTCTTCDCGKASNTCDNINGRCFCSTKGVTGLKCDQCESPRYTGRPNLPDGSCYYNLSTDYQFTFNLNKESDRYYNRIDFVNHPTRGSDDDIDFMVRCFRENAMINISFVVPSNDYYDYDYESIENQLIDYTTTTATNFDFDFTSNNDLLNNSSKYFQNNKTKKEKLLLPVMHHNNYYFAHNNIIPILVQVNCTSSEFKYTFNNRDFNYADKNRNATFIVHVYDFHTPITIQIAFSRRSRIQLLHFFVTFFGCLFSLLALAFISWKTKQRYDRFRRQRQVIIQMEQMASRPFTRLLVDVTKNNPKEKTNIDDQENWQTVKGEVKMKNEKSFRTKKSSFLSRRNSNKKTSCSNNDEITSIETANQQQADLSTARTIMPVAIEPLSNNKTAILTCLLKLPQGGLNLTPKGSSPLVLASAYVQLSSNSPLIKNQINSNPDSIMIDDDDEEQNENNVRTENV